MIIIIIIITSTFQTPKKELSMAIATELTFLTTTTNSSTSEDRKEQVLPQMIK